MEDRNIHTNSENLELSDIKLTFFSNIKTISHKWSLLDKANINKKNIKFQLSLSLEIEYIFFYYHLKDDIITRIKFLNNLYTNLNLTEGKLKFLEEFKWNKKNKYDNLINKLTQNKKELSTIIPNYVNMNDSKNDNNIKNISKNDNDNDNNSKSISKNDNQNDNNSKNNSKNDNKNDKSLIDNFLIKILNNNINLLKDEFVTKHKTIDNKIFLWSNQINLYNNIVEKMELISLNIDKFVKANKKEFIIINDYDLKLEKKNLFLNYKNNINNLNIIEENFEKILEMDECIKINEDILKKNLDKSLVKKNKRKIINLDETGKNSVDLKVNEFNYFFKFKKINEKYININSQSKIKKPINKENSKKPKNRNKMFNKFLKSKKNIFNIGMIKKKLTSISDFSK